MSLNKSKNNMYPWVTHTWNVIKGKCLHDCSYCYMKRYPQRELHFNEKELKTDLGSGNFIFLGSSCDMWADAIPVEWIELVLEHCRLSPQNTYLFQSKNPQRLINWACDLPPKSIIGTTIETNRRFADISKSPSPWQRYCAMIDISFPKMVSIEPIMDFDLDVMVDWMRGIKPEFVSIGADSGGNRLPEPSAEKMTALLEELQKVTTVKLKSNLGRLLGGYNVKEKSISG